MARRGVAVTVCSPVPPCREPPVHPVSGHRHDNTKFSTAPVAPSLADASPIHTPHVACAGNGVGGAEAG